MVDERLIAVESIDRMLTAPQRRALMGPHAYELDGHTNTLEALERRGFCRFEMVDNVEGIAAYVLTDKGREFRRALLNQRERGLR